MKLMDYYMTADLHEPPNIHQREFGIVKKGGRMWRHLSFENVDKLRAFLIQNQPDHVYFSSAKYQDPGNKYMIDKGWLGADLIFDIDLDHLENPTLGEAVNHILKLDNILRKDFALKDLLMAFSGARGYHIHVRDDCIQDLRSYQRREIADYFREYKSEKEGKVKIGNKNYVGIDTPVTGDISRLIRLPGSIHGKTGEQCRIINLEDSKI